MKKIFLVGLIFSVASLQLDAKVLDWFSGSKKFTCSSNSYLFTSDQTASETGVFNIGMKDAKVNFIKTFGKSHINATGYNVKDDYIYGWEYGEGDNYSNYDPHLVMIDADFNVKRVRLSGTLPKTRFYLGDIDSDGIYYLANRHQPINNNVLQEIQRVDLNRKRVLTKLTLDYSNGERYIVASDFAINPKDNQLYTVNANNNQLVRINTTTGRVEELGYVGRIGNTYSVINFFDKNGNFYFYTSDSERIYKIDISNPNSINSIAKAFTRRLTGMVNSGDGARCANAAIEGVGEATVIADYHFDECSWDGSTGEVKDSSGNGFDGIAINSADTDTSDGRVNGSGKFTADNDAVRVDGITGFDSNNFTLSFWTKIDSDGSSTHELIKLENVNAKNTRNGNSGVIELRYRESDNELRVSGERKQSDGSVSGYSQTVTVDMDDGNWHHIVLTYKDENMKIYVDTSDADMIHPTNGISGVSNLGILDDFNGILRIGNSINGLFSTKAQIDEVKLYNGALSSTEISTLHNNEKAGKNYDGTDRDEVVCLLPLGCQATALLSKETEDLFDLDTINKTETRQADIFSETEVNAMGYNPVDGYIWGYDQVSADGTLVKIGKDSSGRYGYQKIEVDNNGYEALNGSVIIGDIDKNGQMYLLKREGIDNGLTAEKDYLYVIDLNSSSDNYLKVVDRRELRDMNRGESGVGKGLNIVDWAFHPKNGKLYGLEKYDKNIKGSRLYEIDPSTDEVKTTIVTGISPEDKTSYEAFFDDNGYFYGYGNKTGRTYRLDLTNPDTKPSEAILFTYVPTDTNGGDTARCSSAPMGNKPVVTIHVADTKEGNSGISDVNITLYSDREIDKDISIKYTAYNSIDNKKATADVDFVSSTGTVILTKGSSSILLPIVKGDIEVEGDEFFTIMLESDEILFLNSSGIESTINSKAKIIDDDNHIVLNAMTTNSGKLTTQVVKNPFRLTIKAFLDNKPQKNVKITNVTVIKDDGTILKSWSGSKLTNRRGVVRLRLKVNQAAKVAKVNIKGKYLGETLENNSTDSFAIRPDHFTLTMPTSNSASENFTLSAKAIDASGNPTVNYNEAIENSFAINYTEKLPNCDTGTLDLSNMSFNNGIVNKNVNYSEVGEVDFNITEIPGREFAIIDRDDTPDQQRYIRMARLSGVEFVADSFEVAQWTLENGSNGFTYYADIDDLNQMGAKLKVALKAVDKNGVVTKNYRSGCYSKPTNLYIRYSVDGTDTEENTLIWEDGKESSHKHTELNFIGDLTNKNFVFDVASTKFDRGETNETIFINFSRDKKIAKDPVRLSIQEVGASDGDASGKLVQSLSADFYYGRLNRPSFNGDVKTPNIKLYYELYAGSSVDKDKFSYVAGKESEDGVHWYILEPSQYRDGVSGFDDLDSSNNDFDIDNGLNPCSIISSTTNTAVINKVDSIAFKVTKLPFRDRMTYKPSPWLVYNRFNDSATKHSFNMNLSSSANRWAGKGKGGKIIDSHISKKEITKMEW